VIFIFSYGTLTPQAEHASAKGMSTNPHTKQVEPMLRTNCPSEAIQSAMREPGRLGSGEGRSCEIIGVSNHRHGGVWRALFKKGYRGSETSGNLVGPSKHEGRK
jgi:hypothetical protein